MITNIMRQLELDMSKQIEGLKHELLKLRSGRAHPGLVEQIKIDYYGTETPLAQVASIMVADARTLAITAWEKSNIKPIEKAIMNAGLGLNPVNDGNVIRIPMPPLNEERRREMVKIVKHEGENARVHVRNLRRDANNAIKELLKQKELSEDDEHRTQDQIQKLTDKYIAEIDKLLLTKEKELMEV